MLHSQDLIPRKSNDNCSDPVTCNRVSSTESSCRDDVQEQMECGPETEPCNPCPTNPKSNESITDPAQHNRSPWGALQPNIARNTNRSCCTNGTSRTDNTRGPALRFLQQTPNVLTGPGSPAMPREPDGSFTPTPIITQTNIDQEYQRNHQPVGLAAHFALVYLEYRVNLPRPSNARQPAPPTSNHTM